MYKEDLALNNQQELICHETQPNPTIHLISCAFYQNTRPFCQWNDRIYQLHPPLLQDSYPRYDTKLHLIMRFPFQRSGGC